MKERRGVLNHVVTIFGDPASRAGNQHHCKREKNMFVQIVRICMCGHSQASERAYML